VLLLDEVSHISCSLGHRFALWVASIVGRVLTGSYHYAMCFALPLVAVTLRLCPGAAERTGSRIATALQYVISKHCSCRRLLHQVQILLQLFCQCLMTVPAAAPATAAGDAPHLYLAYCLPHCWLAARLRVCNCEH
jgi:hypothetical protein